MQTWGTLHARGPEGESIGHLDYAQVGSDTDPHHEVHVEDLQVHPEHQGKGIASALMDRVYAEHPAPAEVTHSLRTGAGAGWWDRYSASRPHVLERETSTDER
jgi:ribosomal protein S18 acetylase RimI-like enzyme